jgi:hypothetical protein
VNPTINNSTTTDKTFAEPSPTNNQASDCSTVVNFDLGEPRKTVGFKCNINLWNAFVPHCKANYGSVCHVLEPIIVALLSSKVNLSQTVKPLHIENFTVERAVRRVRRYSVEKMEETEVVSEVCVVCQKKAFAQAISVGGSRFLCRGHFVKAKSGLVGWKLLEVSL